MILTFIIIFFVLFILALVFNDPLNKRYHSFYEDQQQRIRGRFFDLFTWIKSGSENRPLTHGNRR